MQLEIQRHVTIEQQQQCVTLWHALQEHLKTVLAPILHRLPREMWDYIALFVYSKKEMIDAHWQFVVSPHTVSAPVYVVWVHRRAAGKKPGEKY